MNKSAIGVFDSGVGGLSCVKELLRCLPGEDIKYLGDTLRMPYGIKTIEELHHCAKDNVDFLQRRGVKLIAAACGTVSSNVPEEHMDNLAVPFVDVIKPTVNAALNATKNKRIGIIATPATVHIEYVKKAMDAGKHVLSEIPAVSSLEEAIELKKIVSSHPNLKYMSAENCCFLETITKWKKLYEDGVIGDVFYAEADYLHDIRGLMQDDKGNLTWRAHYDSINYTTHDLGVLLYL